MTEKEQLLGLLRGIVERSDHLSLEVLESMDGVLIVNKDHPEWGVQFEFDKQGQAIDIAATVND